MKYLNTSIEPNKIYTIQEAADQLQVDREAIYKLIRADKLKILRIGKGFRVTGSELLNLFK